MIINKTCPKCSGKMYIDVIDGDEACCINCGHIKYLNGVNEEDPLEASEGRHVFQNKLAITSIRSEL